MRKILTSFAFIAASLTFAQVGVNNEDPKATLHIDAKEKAGASTIKDGILIPRVDRQRAEKMIGVEESTLIYIDDENAGNKAGQAVNIDEKGFYYFKGGVWVKLGGGAAAPTTAKAQTWREFRTADNTAVVPPSTDPLEVSNGGIFKLSSNHQDIPATAFLVVTEMSGGVTTRLPDASTVGAGRMIACSKAATGTLAVVDHNGNAGNSAGSQLKGNGTILAWRGKIFISDGSFWYTLVY